MADLLTRIQRWYKTNCDGDWEHEYGFSINTLDNPGWMVRIDLHHTALENLDFNRNYQNKENEHDWFFIKVEKKVFDISCGPTNLNQVFAIFLDEVLPQHVAPEFLYEVYVPIIGHEEKFWVLAKGRMVTESTLELCEMPALNFSDIMVRNLDHINFTEDNMPKFSHVFSAGDHIITELEEMWNGVKLIAKATS